MLAPLKLCVTPSTRSQLSLVSNVTNVINIDVIKRSIVNVYKFDSGSGQKYGLVSFF